MNQDAIIAAVAGYGPDQVSTFIESALANSDATLHLILQESDEDLQRYLKGKTRVRTYPVASRPDPRDFAGSRFKLAAAIAEQVESGFIMVSDSRDVFIQSDPFERVAADPLCQSHLFLASEPVQIGSCPTNSGWISKFFGPAVLQRLGERKVVCCGTLIGSKKLMQDFLKVYSARLDGLIKEFGQYRWGFDQATLNVMAYGAQLPMPCKLCSNETGPFATLHYAGQFRFDRGGQLLDGGGRVMPVVHQYDRFEWLAKHYRRMLTAGGDR